MLAASVAPWGAAKDTVPAVMGCAGTVNVWSSAFGPELSDQSSARMVSRWPLVGSELSSTTSMLVRL